MTDAPTRIAAPPAMLASGAAAAVLAALPGSRAVGGAVRDVLAGRDVHDIDIAAPFPPEEMATRLKAARLKVFETGLAHGTLTAVLDHQPVEVTSLRRDLTTDGRHAEVAWTTDWREDAARRDFTINAMSMAADGRLWDYFGGEADLAAGLVRFVGDPATRLAEDYLRALRFFRFQARYGRGEPDAAALAAIGAAVPGLARLSVERIWMELKRLLEAPDPSAAVLMMEATGVLQAVLPECHRPTVLLALLQVGAPPDPLLRFDALVGSRSTRAARRLKASGEELQRLAQTNAPLPGFDASDDELRRALVLHGRQRLLDFSWLDQAASLVAAADPDYFSHPGPGQQPLAQPALPARFRARVAEMPVPVFPLLGRDGLAAGIPPGPELGRLLAATRAWWLDQGCTPDHAACLARLQALAAGPA
jgi:poly(A) polymerase